MDRQNTNEKKTLKKGRRGWVISAAIVALLGISAGTVMLQNQSSQNQGQCESVTVSSKIVSHRQDIPTPFVIGVLKSSEDPTCINLVFQRVNCGVFFPICPASTDSVPVC